MEEITLKEVQEKVDWWIQKYGIRYFNELTNMVLLTEEVGELAKIVARKYGEQNYKKSDEAYDMEDEIGDILFVLICLANQTGINLAEAFEKNIQKKINRDGERHINNTKLK